MGGMVSMIGVGDSVVCIKPFRQPLDSRAIARGIVKPELGCVYTVIEVNIGHYEPFLGCVGFVLAECGRWAWLGEHFRKAAPPFEEPVRLKELEPA